MVNPFKQSGKAVSAVWHAGDDLDFWTPSMARTMAAPAYPIALVGGFVAGFFIKKPSSKV